jgi:L-Ala-D/L-Glu epimerase
VKIVAVRSWSERIPLRRPYAIAFATTDAADLVCVELRDDRGLTGLGAAAPVAEITGESAAACAAALAPERVAPIVAPDVDDFRASCAPLAAAFPGTPAARAAVDMALHDLAARRRGVPLADLLGRVHDALPTSITIGIMPEDATLAEAAEYVGRGFRAIKLKIGHPWAAERERLLRLSAALPRHVRVRVDANAALTLEETLELGALARTLDIELVEQPLDPARHADLLRLPSALRRVIALDESLHGEADAVRLASERAAGIFNVKLMKCGGIAPALRMAEAARAAGIDLMWGCMDESVISIAAALHAAYACEATRYLDLDGSFDLARDPASGGFVLEDGLLRTLDAPGLGCAFA